MYAWLQHSGVDCTTMSTTENVKSIDLESIRQRLDRLGVRL